MKKYFPLLGIVGLILTIYGLVSAFSGTNVLWYGIFVIGLTFLFGSINLILNNKSIFNMDRKKVLKQYLLFLLLGILIEIIGRYILNLWIVHPELTFVLQIFEVFLIAYPFALFSIQESYTLLNKYLKSNIVTFFIIYIFTTFLHEIPNTFIWEWVYTIPYVTLEIFHINIVVIVGWASLIAIPLITKKILK